MLQFPLRVLLIAALTCVLRAFAAEPAAEEAVGGRMDTVTVVATGASNMDAASEGDVSQQQLAAQPLLRPGAVLENVPGLIVTQHSGEGKANQYFLRAFNLDHGTDLATEVDGMPVNLPTHAHGQGYSDLNFLIPELVGDLHYKKGPYYADEGDFATAGAVRMDLLNEVPDAATLGFGQDGYRRALLVGTFHPDGGAIMGAADVYHNDGPFDNPDDYNRLNGVLRYHNGGAADFFTATAMAYSGKWNATDQVPERALATGQIGRFGTLNPSDGGTSTRSSLSFNRVRRSDTDEVQWSAYVIRYRLDLFSSFTYYLRDPFNGDQIRQHDDRVVYGFNGSKTWFASYAGIETATLLGVQGRIDDIRDVAIDATSQRQYRYTQQDAAVLESSGALYLENSTSWTQKFRTVAGLREDVFDFDVTDKMRNPDGSCNVYSDPLGCNDGNVRAHLLSPKLGLVLGPWGTTSYFITVADGYHSNDARGVTRDGVAVTPLTRASSAELGVVKDPLAGWHSTLDVFILKLRSELVFNGDAGGTSPSGSTARRGVEWGNSIRLRDWLRADLNAAFSRARFDHNAAPDDLGCAAASQLYPCSTPVTVTGRYIPNSPTNVVDAALIAEYPSGWFGSLRARHFGSAPLVEDNSVRSTAYTTLDLQIGYQRSGQWRLAVDVFNLAGVRWNDIEYDYVSRLRNETTPVPDVIVHPGVPRTVRAEFRYSL